LNTCPDSPHEGFFSLYFISSFPQIPPFRQPLKLLGFPASLAKDPLTSLSTMTIAPPPPPFHPILSPLARDHYSSPACGFLEFFTAPPRHKRYECQFPPRIPPFRIRPYPLFLFRVPQVTLFFFSLSPQSDPNCLGGLPTGPPHYLAFLFFFFPCQLPPPPGIGSRYPPPEKLFSGSSARKSLQHVIAGRFKTPFFPNPPPPSCLWSKLLPLRSYCPNTVFPLMHHWRPQSLFPLPPLQLCLLPIAPHCTRDDRRILLLSKPTTNQRQLAGFPFLLSRSVFVLFPPPPLNRIWQRFWRTVVPDFNPRKFPPHPAVPFPPPPRIF